MSTVILCRVCLRTDVEIRDVPEALVELYYEICNYDIIQNKTLKYCSICEFQLRKIHNFKFRCKQANRVLKTWLQEKLNTPPENLHEQLPLPSIGISNSKACHKVYEYQDLRCDPNLDLTDLSLIKTETFDTDINTHIFITKDLSKDFTETVLARIDFEEVLPKKEFLENFEKVHQKNESKESLLQEDDLPLSDLKEDNCLNLLETDFNDDHVILSNTGNTKSLSKLKRKIIKADTVKPKAISRGEVKPTEVKYEEVDDLSLEELIQKYGADNKVVKARQKFLKNKAKLKNKILQILDGGQFDDLGDNVKMSKDIFVKIFNRYDKCDNQLTIKPGSPDLAQKLKKFLLYLLRKYNPEYETVFHVEYLDTVEKKLQEFNRRKDERAYIESPLKCELCYKGFDAQSQLDYHNKWHKATPNDIVCNICPMRSVSKPIYKVHRKNNHTAVYTCKLCPMVTYHFSVMINHYNQHKGVEYPCPTCLSVYSNKTTLDNHRRQAHATSHICTACARSFVSKKGLIFHKKYKHKDETEAKPEEATTCLPCNIMFDSRAVYTKHERTMHMRRPENVYRCYFCKDGFDSIEALRQHKLKLNHQRAPLQVTHKTSIGAKPRGAKRTRRTRVSDPVKPYRKCPVCLVDVPNGFPTSLYMHYLEAHPDVSYNSAYTDSRNYLCEQCGKTFKVYCYYLDHKNQHTGAKPYACKECPARFATRNNLVHHSERHRPPRHQCKQCGKLFLSAANLFTHRRGHIGDRRFKCDICFKGFLHSSTLKEHIKGVHNQIRRMRKVPSREKSLA